MEANDFYVGQLICSRSKDGFNQCWFECSCDPEQSCSCDSECYDYCSCDSERCNDCGCDDSKYPCWPDRY